MSRRLPTLGSVTVCVVGLLLASITVAWLAPTSGPGSSATIDSEAFGRDRFYDVPSPLGSAAAGTVVRARPAEVRLDGAPPFTTTTVLYRSRTVDDLDQVVSGTLFTPVTPNAGRTLLILAPGSQGMGPQCAPSKQFVAGTEYERGVVASGLGQGWSVAVTDYDGYVNGGSPTYVTGEAMAHAVLDMARAASQVAGSRVTSSSPVLLQGYSQGGAGAAWAAALAPTYAPELDLRGAAVGGVPADVHVAAASLDGTTYVYLQLMGLIGLANAYPDDFPLDQWLNPRGEQVMAQLRRECVDGPTARAIAGTSLANFTVEGSTLDQFAQDPQVAQVLAANRLTDQPVPTIPVYQSHARADEIVPLAQAEELHQAWCAAGVTTRLDLLAGHHGTAAGGSLPLFTAWLQSSVDGEPPASAC
jgi:pimeloyl-ACP methyl ester carboxylesterase